MWLESCVGERERLHFILGWAAHRSQEGTVRATYSVAHSTYLQEQEGPKVPFYSTFGL